ncbi:MAG: outer membrane beta-barrel protein, partial [Methyloprofundus sp.]|nr:outer membrane beta-barrel protein [Methyloprofundus sp.]
WLKLRPEVRYDWADEKAFNNNRGNDQVEFAMDMIITF